MSTKELPELDAWIAEHVMGRKRTDSDGFKPDDTLLFMVDSDGQVLIGKPYRVKYSPPETPWSNSWFKYSPTTDRAEALQVLEKCAMELNRVTKREDFQIVVLYDHGSDKPWCVVTDSVHDEDDHIHVKNCAAEKTLPLAICQFAKNLFSKA